MNTHIFLPFPPTSNLGIKINLIEVNSGTSCERIKTRAECEEAATQKGLFSTVAVTRIHNKNNNPPYCFFLPGSGLFFNDKANSGKKCGEGNRVCVCKKPGTFSVNYRLKQSVETKSQIQ